MRISRVMIGAALAVLVAIPGLAAQAPANQVDLTYRFQQPGNVVVLEWNAPWAVRCVAGGAWAGEKANSGTEAVGGVAGTASYSLMCFGAEDRKATLSWQPPTQYTDGTALPAGYIVGYKVHKGTTTANLQPVKEVQTLLEVFEQLEVGPHTFAVSAVGRDGAESGLSAVGLKTITPPAQGNDSETVRIPNPPMLGEVQ